MKKIQFIFFNVLLLLIAGCDKDFEKINTDPFGVNEIDPAILLAGAQQFTSLGNGWESENTIAQQFVNPFNDGATLGFNFNANIDNFQNDVWTQYLTSIKSLVHILQLLEETDRVNLQSMTRIWKAYIFMNLVDHYGDVPYFNAGMAANGAEYFYPVYDDDAAIYDDLYNELHEAIPALDSSGEFISADLLYGTHAYYPSNNAATQVEKWKKLGNSILLRLGMRYSKLDPDRAASIATEAFNGGVMTSNTDNAFVVYDGTQYTNFDNNNLINNNPRFYYAAEPFVNQLKATNDPRSKYIVASFEEPNNPLGDPDPDIDVADQFGVPVGVPRALLDTTPYRGIRGAGYNYSQINVNVVGSLSAPTIWVTYAQTALLLAEAAHRGWIPGGDAAAQTYYEDGIRADMDDYNLYLSETGSSLPPISEEEANAYISQAGVAYNSANALEQINTQYWIANITNGSEAWANIRRSGYPVLSPNTFDNSLLANGGDGFVHRFSYPDAESSKNSENYAAAVAALGGSDNLVSRVFWDVP